MDIILVQYDNRSDRALRLLMHYTEQYCKEHGYRYVSPNETYNIPTYWIKVALVKYMLETQKREGRELVVGWIDSDAVFVQNISVETIIEMGEKKNFITCLDPGSKTDMNAGVFFVRHSPTTIELMNDWINCYKPNRWKKDTIGKWTTEGRWAGLDYEQGSFNNVILPKYKNTIYLFPEKVMACYEFMYEPETIICHFMYSHKRKIWFYNVRRNGNELLAWMALGLGIMYFAKKRLK